MSKIDLIVNQHSCEELNGFYPVDLDNSSLPEEGINFYGCVNIGSCPGGWDVFC